MISISFYYFVEANQKLRPKEKMSDLGINDELRNILTKMKYNGGSQIKFSELKQKQQVKGSFNPSYCVVYGTRVLYDIQ